MIFDTLASVLNSVTGIGKTVADRLIPDKNLAAQVAAEFEKQVLSQDFQIAAAQIEVNKVEAASPKLFVAGWRPAVGWVCVAGLAYQFVAYPFLNWANAAWHFATVAPPALDMQTLIALLSGILGLGTLRTKEKLEGAQGNH